MGEERTSAFQRALDAVEREAYRRGEVRRGSGDTLLAELTE